MLLSKVNCKTKKMKRRSKKRILFVDEFVWKVEQAHEHYCWKNVEYKLSSLYSKTNENKRQLWKGKDQEKFNIHSESRLEIECKNIWESNLDKKMHYLGKSWIETRKLFSNLIQNKVTCYYLLSNWKCSQSYFILSFVNIGQS